jgi:hypothetical protein
MEVERSAGGNFEKIAEVPNGSSYVDSGLSANTCYAYRVRARNGAGTSSYSNETTACTLWADARDVPLTSTIVWFKADSYLTSGSVSFWPDQSGTWRDASQATKAKQPQLTINALNGLPALHFDGTDDIVQLPDSSLSMLTAGEAFVIVKASSGTPAGSRPLWSLGGKQVSTTAGYPTPSGQIYDTFGVSTSQGTGMPVQPITNYHMYNVLSRTGEWTSRINGVLQ